MIEPAAYGRRQHAHNLPHLLEENEYGTGERDSQEADE
jgi:hypothetical protein